MTPFSIKESTTSCANRLTRKRRHSTKFSLELTPLTRQQLSTGISSWLSSHDEVNYEKMKKWSSATATWHISERKLTNSARGTPFSKKKILRQNKKDSNARSRKNSSTSKTWFRRKVKASTMWLYPFSLSSRRIRMRKSQLVRFGLKRKLPETNGNFKSTSISKLNQPKSLRAPFNHYMLTSSEKTPGEDREIERRHLLRTKPNQCHSASTNVTLKKRDRELLKMTISTRRCLTSSELETFLGAFLFHASKWWWRGTSMKESKEFVETPKLVTQTPSCLQECKPTLTIWGRRRKTISNQLKAVNRQNNCSPSSQLEQDLYPTLEACKRHSSQKWSNLRSRKTQPFQDLSSLVKHVLVLTFVRTWTSKTKLSTLL